MPAVALAIALAVNTAPQQTAHAQRTARTATPAPTPTNPAYDASLFFDPNATSNRFKALRWRKFGPFRGGRVVAVAGCENATIAVDPRVKTSTADLVARFSAAIRVRDRINDAVECSLRIEDIQAQLDARVKMATDSTYAKRVGDAAKALRGKLESVRSELYEVGCHVDQCTLDQPIKLYNMLISLSYQVRVGDYAPTQQHGEIYTDLSGKTDVQLQKLQQLEDTDLNALNKLLEELNLPKVFVPARVKVVS